MVKKHTITTTGKVLKIFESLFTRLKCMKIVSSEYLHVKRNIASNFHCRNFSEIVE